MDKAKEFIEHYKNINQEIKNFYAGLDLKYDEYGKRVVERSESRLSIIPGVGPWIEKMVKKNKKTKN